MDIVVTDCDNLPERTFVSIRIGETRRLGPYRPNEPFRFPASQHTTMKVDLFQLLGNIQIPITNMKSSSDYVENLSFTSAITGEQLGIKCKCVPTDGSSSVSGSMSDKKSLKSKTSKHGAAIKATQYLESHGVQRTLQNMIHALLEKQPESPMNYMVNYLKDHSKEQENFSPNDNITNMNNDINNINNNDSDYDSKFNSYQHPDDVGGGGGNGDVVADPEPNESGAGGGGESLAQGRAQQTGTIDEDDTEIVTTVPQFGTQLNDSADPVSNQRSQQEDSSENVNQDSNHDSSPKNDPKSQDSVNNDGSVTVDNGKTKEIAASSKEIVTDSVDNDIDSKSQSKSIEQTELAAASAAVDTTSHELTSEVQVQEAQKSIITPPQTEDQSANDKEAATVLEPVGTQPQGSTSTSENITTSTQITDQDANAKTQNDLNEEKSSDSEKDNLKTQLPESANNDLKESQSDSEPNKSKAQTESADLNVDKSETQQQSDDNHTQEKDQVDPTNTQESIIDNHSAEQTADPQMSIAKPTDNHESESIDIKQSDHDQIKFTVIPQTQSESDSAQAKQHAETVDSNTKIVDQDSGQTVSEKGQNNESDETAENEIQLSDQNEKKKETESLDKVQDSNKLYDPESDNLNDPANQIIEPIDLVDEGNTVINNQNDVIESELKVLQADYTENLVVTTETEPKFVDAEEEEPINEGEDIKLKLKEKESVTDSEQVEVVKKEEKEEVAVLATDDVAPSNDNEKDKDNISGTVNDAPINIDD